MARRRRRPAPARFVRIAVWLALLAAAGWLLFAFARQRPQDMPWGELDLAQPIGMFTGRKLVALRDEPAQCRLLLDRAGVQFEPLPERREGQCGFADGIRLERGGARAVDYQPRPPAAACPVAAALALWEWEVVQPAARRRLKTSITTIDHLGTYSCRRMYGRDDGAWSEHATANAIDIAGFRTADGRRITVLGDWTAEGAADADEAAFLRDVRDGACDLFSTVLSPDYNAAHRDHLHLDQADRGMGGWRSCR